MTELAVSLDDVLPSAVAVDEPTVRPLVLYVHVPFCRSKCNFCDWVQPIPVADLLRRPGDSVRDAYVTALCAEIRSLGATYGHGGSHRPVAMYWGGGTASDLSIDEAGRICDAFEESFDLSSLTERTIECSPDTATDEKLRFYRSRGFTRVSSGVQSFVDARLRSLGRRHSADEARSVTYRAVDAGFEHVSIDIMTGFPGQEPEEVAVTATEATKLPIDHLSVYSFRPTAGIAMRRRMDPERNSALLAGQIHSFRLAQRIVESAGLAEYAVGYFGTRSPFAMTFFQLSADVLGFGSGASSLIGQQFKLHAKGNLHGYIADPLHHDLAGPADNDRALVQYLRGGLAAYDGIPRDEWQRATGTSIDDFFGRPRIAPLADHLRRRGLVEEPDRIRLPRDRAAATLIELAFQLSAAED